MNRLLLRVNSALGVFGADHDCKVEGEKDGEGHID